MYSAALRVKREQRGVSARALSASLGKSPSYISKVECGEITLSLTGFAEIAAALELSNFEILWVVSQAAREVQELKEVSC
jgi:transcriptional regulator with XRE-family HTH domain